MEEGHNVRLSYDLQLPFFTTYGHEYLYIHCIHVQRRHHELYHTSLRV